MSLRRIEVLLSFACALLPAALTIGCGGGGSSSSDNPVALCMQGCDKTVSLCYADGGTSASSIKNQCASSCSSTGGSTSQQTCSNSNAIISAYKGCLAKTTCNDLMSCVTMIPPCEGGATGGSSGTTGGTAGQSSGSGGTAGQTSGTGGTSGGGTCADLLACCNQAAANLKSACMMTYSAAMPSGDTACGLVLSGAKSAFCP